MIPAAVETPAPGSEQASEHAIGRAIARTDFNRRGAASPRPVTGHKEWLHFCVYAEGLDLLANFSLVDDAHADGARKARTILLVRTARWRGVVDSEPLPACDMEGGAVGLRFGNNSARFVDGRYHLHLDNAALQLSADLTLTPITFPSPTHNVQVPGGPPINWAVVPRLLASGTVTLSGRTHRLHDAPAYHDHNWGDFRWGDDFAWEWGYCLPADPSCPYSVVAVRLSDRAHGVTLAQALFVWRGGRQWRIFRGPQVQARREGLLRPAQLLKLPPPMALLRPSTATDIPERFVMEGASEGDSLCCAFRCEDVAQVIIPNDGRPGTTIINEVKGRFEVRGCIRGESFRIDGGGVFEFLGR